MNGWRRCCIVLIAFSFCSIPAMGANVPDSDTLPPDLFPWQSWVLHGKEKQLCPVPYTGEGESVCAHPSGLNLDLQGKGGSFSQEWLLFSKEWVPLPGGGELWPLAVIADGSEIPVVSRGGVPCIRLKPGRHSVNGAFQWAELPETMLVPAQTAIIQLSVDGRRIDSPHMDNGGRLWIQSRKGAEGEENRVETRVFRLLSDDIPMRVTTLLKLNVSGQPRELRFPGVIPDGAQAMGVRGPLPAKLGTGGELVVQGRPGRFDMEVDSRLAQPVEKLGPLAGTYGREIWAFRPQNQLRMVEVSGVPSVDPSQVDTPASWKNLSTYILEAGAQIAFKQIRRGDPEPAPDQLQLDRTWWLDFDGGGFTVHDKINGTMSRQWSLAMNAPQSLGRVSVDGVDSLITEQETKGRSGVELRKGHLRLSADSRLEGPVRSLPAVGWDHDFQSVSGVLQLPPGWRLLSAGGVDVIPGTWLEKWTLLDIFIVLIIALASARLWNWRVGVLALVGVGLSYHEPDSPRLVWLHLLAGNGAAEIPARRKAEAAGPALVDRVRGRAPGVQHPLRGAAGTLGHLPPIGNDLGGEPALSCWGGAPGVPGAAPAPPAARSEAGLPRSSYTELSKSGSPTAMDEAKVLENRRRSATLAQDPKALVQTGPGLPDWQWKSISMKWNGPVDRKQQIDLWLLSPTMNLFLGFLRIILLALLIYKLLGGRPAMGFGKMATIAVLLMIVFAASAPISAKAGNYPTPELLQQLQDRLLEKPDCKPNCAESARIEVIAGRDTLRLVVEVNAAVQTMVPVPGNSNSWLPEVVLRNEQPAEVLRHASDGTLWMVVPEGIHRVTMIGKLPGAGSVQVPLGMKPHSGKFTTDADWEVQGIQNDGTVETSIQLTRRAAAGAAIGGTGENTIEPFLNVERVLELGLTSQVRTTVRRITPPGTPVMVSVPLVEGESVVTPGIQAAGGRASVHMGTGESKVTWESSLNIVEGSTIRLTAPESASWTETWILDASPIWHCKISGIPAIHHQDQEGYWRPQWRPWAGERLDILVTKPVGIPGQSVTIDTARLQFTPGPRFNKAELALRVRSSQGGQHKITLPEGSELDVVRVMGKAEPIPATGGGKREISVPLQPGTQDISVEWRQGTSSLFLLQGPPVDIGRNAVNATVTFNMPKNRWILWAGGPQLGPAVLFWSYLLVVLLAAFALGRIPWLPQGPLKAVDWFMLGLGLTQIDPIVSLVIVGWLLALGWRRNRTAPGGWFVYDTTQIGLVLLTAAALAGLYYAVHEGLLGIPRMQIAGNRSSSWVLNWTQDRIGSSMPQPFVVSVPLFVFRVFMLFWSLWLARALLRWLRWGWQSMNEGGLWRSRPPRMDKEAPKPSDG